MLCHQGELQQQARHLHGIVVRIFMHQGGRARSKEDHCRSQVLQKNNLDRHNHNLNTQYYLANSHDNTKGISLGRHIQECKISHIKQNQEKGINYERGTKVLPIDSIEGATAIQAPRA